MQYMHMHPVVTTSSPLPWERVQVLATGARKKIVWGTLDMGFIMDVDVGYAYIRSYEVREVSIVRYAQAYKPIINYTTLNGPHCTLSLPS